MSQLKGNLMFGQSGGPTSVINASAAGVFLEALKHSDVIEKVFGAAHGIVGILNEDFYDINQEDPAELELLKYTPSSALGSVRYKMADPAKDETDYRRLLEVFRKYNIRYFFYNGGNDSMDTCNKISKFMQKSGWEIRCMGVPKTIDNDLFGTDHCPGFASAAKYLATSTMEVFLDATVYNNTQITILEVMGRNAGWLTAATALANMKGLGPDLIYLPEIPVDLEQIRQDIAKVFEEKGKVIVAISEGVKTTDGKFLPELSGEVAVDAFGHKQMGGTGEVLATFLKDNFDTKIRTIEFSLLQRCAAHLASSNDIDEAFEAGAMAVRKAVEGMTDHMIGFQRAEGSEYKVEYITIPLDKVANTERKVPREWINEAGNQINEHFYEYALPLIQGEPARPLEDSLPRFAKLKKVKYKA
ncbi:MAG: 6-phosphofructokinase [Clostridia bacterium]|nr:6-phosphofructokinase [Clostridia bacterium]NLF21030.1 6-phosphofructokinase [Clostridiaceae bacterium]